MKIKTAELTGYALDYAVELTRGHVENIRIHPTYKTKGVYRGDQHDTLLSSCSPSTYWGHGGPLIEQEMIDVCAYRGAWRAARYVATAPTYGHGPKPLVAAMRCLVASKLGDEVDIPDELV